MIRRAEPRDLPAMADLLGQLGYPAEVHQVRRRMDRLPDSTTVFVTDDGSGLAALDVRQGLQHDAPAARIVALIVREDARGRGIARALIETIEAAAREAGCRHIHVTSAGRRDDAHAAYTALGYAATGTRFGKDL